MGRIGGRLTIGIRQPSLATAVATYESRLARQTGPRLGVPRRGERKVPTPSIWTHADDAGLDGSAAHKKFLNRSLLRRIDRRAIQRINMMIAKYVLFAFLALFASVNANALGGAHKRAPAISGVSGVSSAVSGVSSTSGKAAKGEHLLKALNGLNGMLADLNDKVNSIRDSLPEYTMDFKNKHSKGVSGTSGISGVSAGNRKHMGHN